MFLRIKEGKNRKTRIEKNFSKSFFIENKLKEVHLIMMVEAIIDIHVLKLQIEMVLYLLKVKFLNLNLKVKFSFFSY